MTNRQREHIRHLARLRRMRGYSASKMERDSWDYLIECAEERALKDNTPRELVMRREVQP
jgi:predicted dinucleotide-utilizing enzyme